MHAPMSLLRQIASVIAAIGSPATSATSPRRVRSPPIHHGSAFNCDASCASVNDSAAPSRSSRARRCRPVATCTMNSVSGSSTSSTRRLGSLDELLSPIVSRSGPRELGQDGRRSCTPQMVDRLIVDQGCDELVELGVTALPAAGEVGAQGQQQAFGAAVAVRARFGLGNAVRIVRTTRTARLPGSVAPWPRRDRVR